jgi:hypothetical protein
MSKRLSRGLAVVGAGCGGCGEHVTYRARTCGLDRGAPVALSHVRCFALLIPEEHLTRTAKES